MRIQCKKIISAADNTKELDESPWLTINKIYTVISIYNKLNEFNYYIIDDSGEKGGFFNAVQFDVIDNIIPSTWVVGKKTGDNIMILLPKAFDEFNSFFEKLHDDDPSAENLFQQEVKKIYNECGN